MAPAGPYVPPPCALTLPDGRLLSYRLFGAPLDAERAADGRQVLIYQHGFLSSSMEAGVLHRPASALGVSIVAFDRPGSGFSTHNPHKSFDSAAADVAVLMDHLGLKTTMLMGVSGGSPFAAATAAALGPRALGLLLMVPLAPLAGRSDLLSGVSWKSAQVLQMLNRGAFGSWNARGLLHLTRMAQVLPGHLTLRMGGFSSIDLAAVKAYPQCAAGLRAGTQLGLAQGIEGAYQDLELYTARPHSLAARLPAISCPTIAWAGSADQTTPPGHARYYVSAIPGAQLRVAEGEGHLSLPFRHGRSVLESLILAVRGPEGFEAVLQAAASVEEATGDGEGIEAGLVKGVAGASDDEVEPEVELAVPALDESVQWARDLL